ncbi:unnamed protein product [Closterium sp. NIES-64]|nr:unnamed protein product [Closterium sp. NIES-64]
MFTRKNSRSSDISSHPSVLELTFRVLPPRDLAAAACVCREWRAAATSEPLWHRHTIARWPALASPAVARRVSDSCGFYLFYRKRFLRPGRASPLPFHLDDLTFFFDLSFHGSPVFSQAFKYEGGRALVPFAHHTFSDPSAIFPSIEALDKDSFRRSLAEKLIPASSSGSSIGTSSSSSNTTNLMGAAAAAAAAGVAAAAAAAGGAGAAANVEMTPVNVLARTGAMEVNLTALKDRLGGTVRVDIAGKEFLLVLSALQWE